MPSVSASSGFSKSFADVNSSTPVLGLTLNLSRSAPPAAPAGIDQAKGPFGVLISLAVSGATSVGSFWFSAAVKLIDPVTHGVEPRTVTLAGADSRRPSGVHGTLSGLQASWLTGRVMVTSP